MYQTCPKRRTREQMAPTHPTSTYAIIAAGGTPCTEYRIGHHGTSTPIIPSERQLEPTAGEDLHTEEEMAQHPRQKGPAIWDAAETQWPPLDKEKEQSGGQTAQELSAKPTIGDTERVGDQPAVKVKRKSR
jgi:hypothetical protein